MKKWRIIFLFFIFILIGSAVGVRLWYIEEVNGEEYSKQAVAQRKRDEQIKNSRGIIYDRNLLPLTDVESGICVVLSSTTFEGDGDVLSRIGSHCGISAETIQERMKLKNPLIIPVKNMDMEFMNFALDNKVKVINLDMRYSGSGVASHIVGYIPDKDSNAGFGIEKAYDDILSKTEKMRLGLIYDGGNRTLSEMKQSLNVDNLYGGVKLSIDYHFQKTVENILDAQVEKGAVVVSHIESGEILAMASRPNFFQTNITEYFNKENGEMINRAISAYDAGSIFKIITVSAVLEEGIAKQEDKFFCGGTVDINGMEFYCSSRGGHGTINLEEAFAYSCNMPFYDLGQKLGFEKLMEYAKKFGLSEGVLNCDDFAERKGNLPKNEYISAPKIANTSIGQGEVMLTPVQITSVVSTIARGGIRRALNLGVTEVDGYGNVIQNLKDETEERVLSAETAGIVREMMKSVVKYGTGKLANPSNRKGAGGKTSSAETGWEENGELKVHAWFAGFYPADEPKFVITVFIENGKKGGAVAAPVFKDIAEGLEALRREEYK